ncbi:hypothetical protein AB0C40_30865 [Streptomyces brevispora]|uniref:hypothetical protein n=1 Tax=Streptomyces brevispora TaxID=887462 RepID=UPI0033CE2E9E
MREASLFLVQGIVARRTRLEMLGANVEFVERTGWAGSIRGARPAHDNTSPHSGRRTSGAGVR